MIIMLDANALIGTPLQRPSWRIISLSGQEWGVKVMIPQVSALEFIGHERRNLEEEITLLKKPLKKHRDIPQLSDAIDALESKLDLLEEQLTSDLEAVGASFVDPVAVGHLEIVRRQTARKKPCKGSGDGYRDTLNWLTFLEIARVHPDELVVWISGDGDFNGKDNTSFHPDLIAEAEEIGVAERISLYPSLGFVLNKLLQENALPLDHEKARKSLIVKAIQKYVCQKVLPSLEGDEEFAQFYDLTWPDEGDVEVGRPSGLDDGGAAWPFSTAVSVGVLPDSQLGAFQLSVDGLVATDKFDNPTGGEISETSIPPEAETAAVLADRVVSIATAQALVDIRRNVVAHSLPSRKIFEAYESQFTQGLLASHISESVRKIQRAQARSAVNAFASVYAQSSSSGRILDQVLKSNRRLIFGAANNPWSAADLAKSNPALGHVMRLARAQIDESMRPVQRMQSQMAANMMAPLGVQKLINAQFLPYGRMIDRMLKSNPALGNTAAASFKVRLPPHLGVPNSKVEKSESEIQGEAGNGDDDADS